MKQIMNVLISVPPWYVGPTSRCRRTEQCGTEQQQVLLSWEVSLGSGNDLCATLAMTCPNKPYDWMCVLPRCLANLYWYYTSEIRAADSGAHTWDSN